MGSESAAWLVWRFPTGLRFQPQEAAYGEEMIREFAGGRPWLSVPMAHSGFWSPGDNNKNSQLWG